MTASKVWFTTMRTEGNDSVPAKLTRLLRAAGVPKLGLEGQFVAIKTHFGELGNLSYLRPGYLRVIADMLAEQGARPFATDCSTLYPGMRSNAIDHVRCAELNGFTTASCGCPVIMSDGVRGRDEVTLPVPEPDPAAVDDPGLQVTEAYIGHGIVDADFMVTLTHAKGCHISAYGGVLKNLSMGCASRAGKMVMHANGKPFVSPDLCVGCGSCIPGCGQDAISIVDHKARIGDSCVGCGHCIPYCTRNAIMATFNNSSRDVLLRMAEYASAVVAAQKCFHVAVAIDITPGCDCFPNNDVPVVPNIGMFASADPVALDQCICDMINQQQMITDSRLPGLHEAYGCETDHVHALNPEADWELILDHAAALGAGTREYELVQVK